MYVHTFMHARMYVCGVSGGDALVEKLWQWGDTCKGRLLCVWVCACVFFCVMSERINSGEILTGGEHLRSVDVGARV